MLLSNLRPGLEGHWPELPQDPAHATGDLVRMWPVGSGPQGGHEKSFADSQCSLCGVFRTRASSVAMARCWFGWQVVLELHVLS